MIKAKEERIREIGKKLFSLCGRKKFSLSAGEYLKNKTIIFCAENPELKTRLFRFIDVLPALKTSCDINSHFQMYLGDLENLPLFIRTGLFLSENSFTSDFSSRLIRFGIEKTAKNRP